ncbi:MULTISPECIES: FtsB family cell division protein [Caldisericum]|jgi:cell division protein FtsB|uniref:Septum formation initiator family protein n=1 Tax=Caldisericum exile TaxID=693075 RepID=A0A2J6WE54_9BACT|nr:MAG: hypothetical protein C0189_03605 [Caldisericum exile]
MRLRTTILLAVLFVLILIYGGLFFATVKIKIQISSLDAEIEALKTRNQLLTYEYLKLQDPTYVETIAKEKLHMIEVKNFYVVEINPK